MGKAGRPSNEDKPALAKSNWLEEFSKQRSDLFYSDTWNESQREQAAEIVRSHNVKSKMFTDIPMRCRGPKCQFAEVCPYVEKNIAPVGKPCPIEQAFVVETTQSYMNSLGVDPENLAEVSIVRDIVDQMIQMQRKTWLLSKEDFIQENPVGVNDKGEVIMRKELHLAVELEDKLHRRLKDLRNQLMITREARAKVGQGQIDNAKAIANIVQKVREVELEKEKALRKQLDLLTDEEDYVDAEIIEDSAPDNGS